MEEWKDIPGFEGYYQASSYGSIRSCDRMIIDINGNSRWRASKILRPSFNKCGYLRVVLCKNNVHHYYTVHYLIAITFIQQIICDNLVINHKDGNKINNASNNLEVVTQLANRSHAIEMGLWNQRGEHSVRAKLSEKEANDIRLLRLKQHLTYQELANRYNVGTSTISRIVNHQSYKQYVY